MPEELVPGVADRCGHLFGRVESRDRGEQLRGIRRELLELVGGEVGVLSPFVRPLRNRISPTLRPSRRKTRENEPDGTPATVKRPSPPTVTEGDDRSLTVTCRPSKLAL
jgi:hypothetical protein